jgi:hypothetical protein
MRGALLGLLVVVMLLVALGVLGWVWLLAYTHTPWPG